MTDIPVKLKQLKYATHIPNRHPAWKAHSNIGHAKSAIVNKIKSGWVFADMTIWELDADNEWQLLWTVPSSIKRYEDLPWNNTEELKEKRLQEERKWRIVHMADKAYADKNIKVLGWVWELIDSEPLEDQTIWDAIPIKYQEVK